MGIDLDSRDWLADLVEAHLAGYDPVGARLRLPSEVREAHPDGPSAEARARMLVLRSLRRRLVEPGDARPEAAFLAPIEGHVSLLLDLALLQGGAFQPARRRAELAAFFAVASGEVYTGLSTLPRHPGGLSAPARVEQAFHRAGLAAKARGYPPGDPAEGLPLYAGSVAIARRLLARIALAHWRGQLDAGCAARRLAEAHRETALLVEAVAGLVCADGPPDAARRRVVRRQLGRLHLPRAEARHALSASTSPRPARQLAHAVPAPLRTFLLEQVLLAALSAPATPARSDFIGQLAEGAGLGPEQLAALQVEAAAFHADHRRWLEAFGMRDEPEWQPLLARWNELGDRLVEKVASAVTENLQAVVTEIRQTGELGQLLAKAAAGKALSPDEKQRMKARLVDLAKAVPALAIIAAPGGLLLLPLLAKILPFNLLPSAFQGDEKAPARPPKPGRPRSA